MRYCPQCAASLESRHHHGRLRQVCPSCGWVYYRNPLPVAACIVESPDGIYLIRRRFDPGKGQWGLPAGFIEVDESPQEAAVRETAEETGLVVQPTGLVGVYPYHERTGQGSGVVIAYHAHVVGGTPVAGDDAAEVWLFHPDALPEDIAFETHRAALDDWLYRLRGERG